MATSKISKDCLFQTYNDGQKYTVGANNTRDVSFTIPSHSGYEMKSLTARIDQNYVTVGVSKISNEAHVTMHNRTNDSLDVGIYLQYIFEKIGGGNCKVTPCFVAQVAAWR